MTILALTFVFAIASPLASTNDYHFTYTPPGYVHGIITGDSDTGPGPLRLEDKLFLNEAINERKYYSPGQTTSSWMRASLSALAATNAHTARISGFAVSPDAGYITPDSRFSSEPRLIYLADPEGESVTNLNSEFTYTDIWYGFEHKFGEHFFDGYLAITNYISQVMKDGSVNVFTNVVPANGNLMTKNEWNESVLTGRLELVDFMFEPRMLEWCEQLPSNRFCSTRVSPVRWYRRQDVTDAFAVVRDMRMKYTGVPEHVDYESSDYFDGERFYYREQEPGSSGPTDTNYIEHVGAARLVQRESHSYSEGEYSNDRYGEWETETSSYRDKISEMSRSTGTFALELLIGRELDRMWCPSGRFKEAYGFAHMRVTKERSESRSWSSNGGDGSDSTNLTWKAEVMIPLGKLDSSQQEDFILLTSRKTSQSVVSDALSESGIRGMTYKSSPTLPDMVEGETVSSESGSTHYREKHSSVFVIESLRVEPVSFYVVYTFRPVTTW